jgi:hypothetical protein
MSPRLLRPKASGFTPRNLSGLVAWFDADDLSTFTLSGTAVSEWRDKSGNGYSVAQTDSNNRPARTGTVRGRATVDFDGTNDFLITTSGGLATAYSGDKTVDVYCVGEMHTDSEVGGINSTGTWWSWGSGSSGTPFLYARSNAGNGVGQFQLRNDANSTTGSITTASGDGPAGDGGDADTSKDFFIVSTAAPSEQNTVFRVHTIMTATGNSISGRPKSGATTTSADARPAGNTTVDRFAMGCFARNTNGDFYPARISEVIIYNRILSAAERAKLVTALSKKYNNEAVPVL